MNSEHRNIYEELIEHRQQLINCKQKLKAGVIRCVDVVIYPYQTNPDDHIYIPTVLNQRIVSVIIRMLESATAEIERELKTLNN